MPRWAILIVATIGGSLLASFLRLVWDRRSTSDGHVFPPSRCPACHAPLRGIDRVPVLGWLWLGGKCRHCQANIGASHLVGEVIGALMGFGTAVWVT